MKIQNQFISTYLKAQYKCIQDTSNVIFYCSYYIEERCLLYGIIKLSKLFALNEIYPYRPSIV